MEANNNYVKEISERSIFNVEECEKKIKSARASFSVRITDISTLNKVMKGDPKKVHNLLSKIVHSL